EDGRVVDGLACGHDQCLPELVRPGDAGVVQPEPAGTAKVFEQPHPGEDCTSNASEASAEPALAEIDEPEALSDLLQRSPDREVESRFPPDDLPLQLVRNRLPLRDEAGGVGGLR